MEVDDIDVYLRWGPVVGTLRVHIQSWPLE